MAYDPLHTCIIRYNHAISTLNDLLVDVAEIYAKRENNVYTDFRALEEIGKLLQSSRTVDAENVIASAKSAEIYAMAFHQLAENDKSIPQEPPSSD